MLHRDRAPIVLVVVLGVVAIIAVVINATSGGSSDEASPGPADASSSSPPPTSRQQTPESMRSAAASNKATESTATSTPPVVVSTGEFSYADEGGRTFGVAPFRQFSVATEQGSGIDPDELAAIVDDILADARSWIADGVTGLERVTEGGEFTIAVATPATVDELCLPLETIGYFSCARNGWVALNLDRWNHAIDEWPASLDEYRAYVVNHEVGHYLLGPDHATCPGAGQPAPVMMQQTKGLEGCVANGWPYPDG